MEDVRAKEMRNVIAGLRIEKLTWEEIRDLIEDCLDDVKDDEAHGEYLAKYYG